MRVWPFKEQKTWNSICLYPAEKGGIQFENITKPKGKLWDYYNKWVYLLRWDPTTKKLLPYEPPDKIRMLPETLYYAITGTAPIRRTLSYKATWMDKLSLGVGVGALGITLFMLFLIYITSVGG